MTAAAHSLSKEPGIPAKVVTAVASHFLKLTEVGEEADGQKEKIVQTIIDVAPAAAQAFMETTVRQHSASPAQTLNNVHIMRTIKEQNE